METNYFALFIKGKLQKHGFTDKRENELSRDMIKTIKIIMPTKNN